MEAHLACEQAGCGLPAVACADWPGQQQMPAGICEEHLAWAIKIADALGFKLRYERLQTPAPPGLRKITL